LGKALSLLEQEAKNLNEDDPRQAAHLTRKLCDITGLLGSRMEEAIRRMEAGEDPEKIENEMGDILKEENLFNKSSKASKKAKKEPPVRDETLYKFIIGSGNLPEENVRFKKRQFRNWLL
jgi:hypothetical protein